MGGHGSGRSGGRPTTEGSITLNLSRLMHDGTIIVGGHGSGTIFWTNSAGQHQYSVGFEASLDADRGWLRLKYRKKVWGETCDSDYRVELTATPQPFGGRRWWFLCPMTGRRALKLYLPLGASIFASRQAHRLGYSCQRETPHDRAIERAFKLRRKLADDGGIGDPIWKPKWMRQATFDREIKKVEAAEGICNVNLEAFLDRLQARS